MFALVDCNNFYASCERIFQPSLNDKPIAILSNNDGCVIARSNEVKRLGLPMGAPAHKFSSFFRQYDVKVFSSNYPLYGDMSNRVMDVLRQFTPEVEVYSIDEAFLHFQGFENYNMEQYAREMQKRVLKWTGMPVSIGVGPTKALSKVANRVAKKFNHKTNNVYVINSNFKRIKALKWLPISSVWGIGRQHARRLAFKQIETAYDFTQLSDEWVRKEMSVVGLRLKNPQYRNSTLIGMPFATRSTLTITKYALRGLEQIFRKNIKYKKAGVIVTGIVPSKSKQMTLFDREDYRHNLLMSSIDKIHQRYGPHKIKLANQDINRTFKMKQTQLSPRYTTDVRHIIKVK